jgi:hypothetical protein
MPLVCVNVSDRDVSKDNNMILYGYGLNTITKDNLVTTHIIEIYSMAYEHSVKTKYNLKLKKNSTVSDVKIHHHPGVGDDWTSQEQIEVKKIDDTHFSFFVGDFNPDEYIKIEYTYVCKEDLDACCCCS